MTTRRGVLALGAASLLPLPALAQPSRKPMRIAWFSGGTLQDQRSYVEAFRTGMRELGYREGADFHVQYFWRGETIKPFSWMARDVVGAQPDVIMATCEITATATKELTRTIPIVLTASTDPVAHGLVPSLARPGGNITGISSSLAEVSAKRVELVKELLPRAGRVMLLRWKYERLNEAELDATQRTARRLGIELVLADAEDQGDFEEVFSEARKSKASAVLDMAGLAWSFPYLSLLAELQVKHRLPAVHFVRELVERGGLLSYGPSIVDGFRRSAHYVDRLAKGARAGDLPIEQPNKLELCVNARTARALGIAVPDSILVRADAVFG